MQATKFYVVTKKAQIGSFIREADRAYFSKPVLVDVLRNEGGLVYVRDNSRGDTYPVDPRDLKPQYVLTRAQRAATEAA